MATVALDGVKYIIAEEAAKECVISSNGVAATINTDNMRIIRFTLVLMITYQNA
jgi:hypothetical protein